MGPETITADDLDDWLEDKKPAERVAPSISPTDDAGQVDDAREYVSKMDIAVSGQGGHSKCLAVARTLVHDFGLSEGTAAALLHEYSQRCQPAWSDAELAHKIRQAVKLSQSGDCENPYRSKGRKAKLDYQIVKSKKPAHGQELSRGVPWNVEQTALSVDQPAFIWAGELVDQYPDLRTPIVHGLLREGETANVIAAPKTGKSWLVTDLALSLATGEPWLGFDVVSGPVLILDNELHAETVADRLPRVAKAKGISPDRYANRIAYKLLRGQLQDVRLLENFFSAIEPRQFKLIILDAFYRFIPPGVSENDNNAMAGVFNAIDAFAHRLHCGFVLIHHSSKGFQSDKSVTDVGAGAGSISRAVDCHLVMRSHQEDGVVVLDAAPRSWPAPGPRCLRFDFPLWRPTEGLSPDDLKRPASRSKKALPGPSTTTAIKSEPEWTPAKFAAKFVTDKPQPKEVILSIAVESGLAKSHAGGLLARALQSDHAFPWKLDNNRRAIANTPQPALDFAAPGRAAILRMLAERPELSLRKIAELCGVKHSYVSKIRSEAASTVVTQPVHSAVTEVFTPKNSSDHFVNTDELL